MRGNRPKDGPKGRARWRAASLTGIESKAVKAPDDTAGTQKAGFDGSSRRIKGLQSLELDASALPQEPGALTPDCGRHILHLLLPNGSGRGWINAARNLPGILLGFFSGVHAHSMHCRVDSSEYKTLRGNTSSVPLGAVESRHFSSPNADTKTNGAPYVPSPR